MQGSKANAGWMGWGSAEVRTEQAAPSTRPEGAGAKPWTWLSRSWVAEQSGTATHRSLAWLQHWCLWSGLDRPTDLMSRRG